MNIRKIYIYVSIAAVTLGISSCDDYLDKLPDNRMELNSNFSFRLILITILLCWQKCILTIQMSSK